MKKVKECAISQGKSVLGYYPQHRFFVEYTRYLQETVEQNPIAQKTSMKRGKAKKMQQDVLLIGS